MPSELSTGKTVFILAVVVGCFAILWPKVFYPMLTAPVKPEPKKASLWRDSSNAHFLNQLCFLLEETRDPIHGLERWSDNDCYDQLKKSCQIDITEKTLENYRLSKDKTNLTDCLRQKFDITVNKVAAAAPPTTRTKAYQPQAAIHPHARAERPNKIHDNQMHPALREKGRNLPQRTIHKEARPGPLPGIRPPLGGGGHMVPPPQSKGSGAMGIIMPLYTVGIVVFFLYTILKVLSKKSCDEEKEMKQNELPHETEYKKYTFDEEYLDSANASHRDALRRQERENSRIRRRQEVTPPDTKIDSIGVEKDEKSIEDEQMEQLRSRLEETERAMERLMTQMGSVTDKLTAAKITEVLTQAQTQAKYIKDFGEGASDDDVTTSEAFTNTLSEDYSLPYAIQRHLYELQVKDLYLKGTSAKFKNRQEEVFFPETDEQNVHKLPATAEDINNLVAIVTSSAQFNENEIVTTNDVISLQRADSDSTSDGSNSSEVELIPLKGVNVLKRQSEECDDEIKLNENQIISVGGGLPSVELPMQKDKEILLKESLDQFQTRPYECNRDAEDRLLYVKTNKLISPNGSKMFIESKSKEEISTPSDIAQYDDPSGSDCEISSNASETGADISDIKSFADDGFALPTVSTASLPTVEEQVIPEVIFVDNLPPIISPNLDNNEKRDAIIIDNPNATGMFQKSANISSLFDCSAKPNVNTLHTEILSSTKKSEAIVPGIEHATQTDREQIISVLNVGTSYHIDKNQNNMPLDISEIADKVNEIILDATIPIDTQLLVREAQVKSRPFDNIEIDDNEIGKQCVVTSHVSLAFVGLEHSGDSDHSMKLIIPDRRKMNLAQNDNSMLKENRNLKLDAFQLTKVDDTVVKAEQKLLNEVRAKIKGLPKDDSESIKLHECKQITLTPDHEMKKSMIEPSSDAHFEDNQGIKTSNCDETLNETYTESINVPILKKNAGKHESVIQVEENLIMSSDDSDNFMDKWFEKPKHSERKKSPVDLKSQQFSIIQPIGQDVVEECSRSKSITSSMEASPHDLKVEQLLIDSEVKLIVDIDEGFKDKLQSELKPERIETPICAEESKQLLNKFPDNDSTKSIEERDDEYCDKLQIEKTKTEEHRPQADKIEEPILKLQINDHTILSEQGNLKMLVSDLKTEDELIIELKPKRIEVDLHIIPLDDNREVKDENLMAKLDLQSHESSIYRVDAELDSNCYKNEIKMEKENVGSQESSAIPPVIVKSFAADNNKNFQEMKEVEVPIVCQRHEESQKINDDETKGELLKKIGAERIEAITHEEQFNENAKLIEEISITFMTDSQIAEPTKTIRESLFGAKSDRCMRDTEDVEDMKVIENKIYPNAASNVEINELQSTDPEITLTFTQDEDDQRSSCSATDRELLALNISEQRMSMNQELNSRSNNNIDGSDNLDTLDNKSSTLPVQIFPTGTRPKTSFTKFVNDDQNTSSNSYHATDPTKLDNEEAQTSSNNEKFRLNEGVKENLSSDKIIQDKITSSELYSIAEDLIKQTTNAAFDRLSNLTAEVGNETTSDDENNRLWEHSHNEHVSILNAHHRHSKPLSKFEFNPTSTSLYMKDGYDQKSGTAIDIDAESSSCDNSKVPFFIATVKCFPSPILEKTPNQKPDFTLIPHDRTESGETQEKETDSEVIFKTLEAGQDSPSSSPQFENAEEAALLANKGIAQTEIQENDNTGEKNEMKFLNSVKANTESMTTEGSKVEELTPTVESAQAVGIE